MRCWDLEKLRKVCLIALAVSTAGMTLAVHGGPAATPEPECEACKIILLDSRNGAGDSVDKRISETQARIKSTARSTPQIERLGWLFVEKARVSNDPGFYKLAEECAACLQSKDSNSADALLLKGHVLHSLHHFKEAEPLAIELTKTRGLAFDFGLLGDVEFDEGKIPDAIAAYQKMVNLRPDLQSYSRVAQVRWITGDLPGAVEAMKMAAEAGSPLNAEPTSWTYARLAMLQLETGDASSAKRSAQIALKMETNSAAAFLALGRVQWVDGETNAAIESLTRAAALNPLPETQWLLADTLRAAGKLKEAAAVENELDQRGISEDPRSFAVYLATAGKKPELSLKLAQRELDVRGDVFTHDAFAWALHANGKNPEARAEIVKALADGTQNARLFLHAGVIYGANGDRSEAQRYAQLSWAGRQMLFPSELETLTHLRAQNGLVSNAPPNLPD